jgi:hypothetical protein
VKLPLKKTREDLAAEQLLKREIAKLLEKHFQPLPLPKAKRRAGFVDLSSGELIVLQQSLRKLQGQVGETFWRLSQILSRFDDELNRRESQ